MLQASDCLKYPHVLRWDRYGRQWQLCRILRAVGGQAHIEFEDGFQCTLDRRALKRAPKEAYTASSARI